MKHTGLFKAFLDDVVNLNATRIQLLEDSVEAIKTFIRSSDWAPRVRGFVPQGSWAHGTIIRPETDQPFDADLLVRVSPVEGWEAKDYVNELYTVFKASGTYGELVSRYSHCVTITYAGQRKIDVAPLVIDRDGPGEEVCNRTFNDYEDSAPGAYTEWFNQRNGWSGSNSFRKVTRLLKYLRASKRTFTCPSVLLTTIVGSHIHFWDKGADAFADTPATLQTLVGRIDDWLQTNPVRPTVLNPSLTGEDLGLLISHEQYETLRASVRRYRTWIDEAIAEADHSASIAAWQRVFGEKFGKNAVVKASVSESAGSLFGRLLSSVAEHSDSLVDAVMRFGTGNLPAWFNRPPHMQEPIWPRAPGMPTALYVSATLHTAREARADRRVTSGDALAPRGGLWFEAHLWAGAPISPDYRVQWRITNTGRIALLNRCGRGEFYAPQNGNRRWEPLSYRGVHLAEAFLLRRHDDVLVGQSQPFHVLIE